MSEDVLRIAELVVSYRNQGIDRRVLHGVGLSVAEREVVTIVGESGSGKSTLAHSIIGLLDDSAMIEHGEVTFGSTDLASLPTKDLASIRGSHIGFIPQDPAVSLNPLHRVGDQVAEVFRLHEGLDRRTSRRRAIEVLATVGLDDPELRSRQFPHELSGGMRQRVLIAIAIAGKPKLIIADEATSALDVTIQRQVLDELERLTRDLGASLLLITHDLAVAAERSDRIVVLNNGKVIEQGSPRELLLRPQHHYTRHILGQAPSMSSERLKPAVRDQGVPADSPAAEIVVENIVKTFGRRDSARRAVDDVSFTVAPGTTLAIVGESGSGKSTTARILTKLAAPDSGRVTIDGVDVTGLRSSRQVRELRRKVQFVYQNPYGSLDPRKPVEWIIAEPLRAFKLVGRAGVSQRVQQLLADVALDPEIAQRKPRELSGGQRQRVAIARALAPNPEVLVLDEPVSALDASVQTQVLQLLTDLQAMRNLTYLLITHDLAVVRQVADRALVMRAGKVVESGDVESVFSAPKDAYTRALIAAVPNPKASMQEIGESP